MDVQDDEEPDMELPVAPALDPCTAGDCFIDQVCMPPPDKEQLELVFDILHL